MRCVHDCKENCELFVLRYCKEEDRTEDEAKNRVHKGRFKVNLMFFFFFKDFNGAFDGKEFVFKDEVKMIYIWEHGGADEKKGMASPKHTND